MADVNPITLASMRVYVSVVQALLATFVSVRLAMHFGQFATEPSGGGPIVIQAATSTPTTADLRWAQRLESITDDALANTRAAAGSWASTITAVTGVFGIFALIKGRQDITALDHAWEIAVAAIVAVALLFALRSIVLAALASEGTPTFAAVDASNVRKFYRQATEIAALQLLASRVLAVLATLLIGVAIGIVWFAPAAPTPPALSYVTTADGTLLCGSVSVGSNGKLLLKQAGATGAKALDPANVRAVVSTPSCPA